MRIVGSFASFKAWVGDNPEQEARAVLYQANPQGRVTAVLYPRIQIEWAFPANENVTITQLLTAVRFVIKADSWTFTS